ncbi:peptidyl-prolyl cis-trans isomerase [Candidatus Woesearchaeota archaeon]|nr:peptidyl-prolyl cis-trans isomerase [Candidatus Woesearchaeota archaeon]
MAEKKPMGMITTIIILIIIVLILGMTLLSRTNPLDSITKRYAQYYPTGILMIRSVSGENALAIFSEINNYCPGFSLDNYYIAQIDDASQQKSLLFMINPVTGRTECIVDKSANINASQSALSKDLLATVNGEPVYMSDVLAIYNNIPEASRTNTSMQESFDNVINNKLLIQDAKKKGLVVEESEIDNAINTFLSNNGMTLQQLEQSLANTNSDMQAFRQNVRNNLFLLKEISAVTKSVNNPTEAEIRAYYDQNPQQFLRRASASTKQLLKIANQSNADQKLEEIKAIASLLNTTNFCELISKYSDDLISVPRCGEYDFEQGQVLPEYEQLVFNSTPGTTRLFQTRLGYHIVQIISITPSQQLSYEEAKATIQNYLLLIRKQAALDQYTAQLRQEAEIVSYLNK